jgi:hypothetical protein
MVSERMKLQINRLLPKTIDRECRSLTASDRHRQPNCEPEMKVLPSVESAYCSLISSKSRNESAGMAATRTLSFLSESLQNDQLGIKKATCLRATPRD